MSTKLLKARLGGLILWVLLFVPAALGILLLPALILFASIERAKPALRAWDHIANAALFAGSPYESLSSHSWRERTKWWAKAVIWITDLLQKGHCEEANRHEQPVVDAIKKIKGGGHANQ